jgi:Ni/Co efflux regulator RcnB
MKRRLLLIAAAISSANFTGLVAAKDHGGGDDGEGKSHREDRGRDGGERDDHRGKRHDHGNNRRGSDERGAGPDHDFYRGNRLPAEYRDRQHRVEDWRGHRLSAPPPGYHWVQVGGDYVLAANSTGIIFQILLGQ